MGFHPLPRTFPVLSTFPTQLLFRIFGASCYFTNSCPLVKLMGCKHSSPVTTCNRHEAVECSGLLEQEASTRSDIEAECWANHPLSTSSIATSQFVLVILHGVVYDCTHFASSHPGGPYVLLKNRGSDMGSTFDRIHSRTTKSTRLAPLRVGPVVTRKS